MATGNAQYHPAAERRIVRAGFTWLWVGAAVVLLVLFGLAAYFFLFPGRTTRPTPTVSAIVSAPQDFYGRTVTVRGRVEDLIGRSALTMVDPGAAGGGGLLVINAALTTPPSNLLRPLDPSLNPSSVVEVTGTVRRLERDAVAEELGRAAPGTAVAQWIGGPVLVAQTITRAAATAVPSGGQPTAGTSAPGAAQELTLRVADGRFAAAQLNVTPGPVRLTLQVQGGPYTLRIDPLIQPRQVPENTTTVITFTASTPGEYTMELSAAGRRETAVLNVRPAAP
jgi:hypothetical protein